MGLKDEELVNLCLSGNKDLWRACDALSEDCIRFSVSPVRQL